LAFLIKTHTSITSAKISILSNFFYLKQEAEKFQLTGNRFYHVLLGELYSGLNGQKAHEHLGQRSLGKMQQ